MRYLVECLRKPEYYNHEVEVHDPEGDLRRYNRVPAIPIPTGTMKKTDLKNMDKTIENYLCRDEKCGNILRDLTKTLEEG